MLITKDYHNTYYVIYPNRDECLAIWLLGGQIIVSKKFSFQGRGYPEVALLEILVVTGLTEDRINKLWDKVPHTSRGWVLDERLRKEVEI